MGSIDVIPRDVLRYGGGVGVSGVISVIQIMQRSSAHKPPPFPAFWVEYRVYNPAHLTFLAAQYLPECVRTLGPLRLSFLGQGKMIPSLAFTGF